MLVPRRLRPVLRRVPLLAGAALAALAGCSNVSSSGVQTGGQARAPYHGAVAVAATFVPAGAVEVGIAQATGVNTDITQLVPQFAGQVAALGGNYGLIESISTQFEMVTSTQSYTYSCGTAQHPQTCYGTRTVQNEMATTQMVGRAFRVEGLAP